MKILILQYLQPYIDLRADKETEWRYFLGLTAFMHPHEIKFRLHPEAKNRAEYVARAKERKVPAPDFDDENVPFRHALNWPELVIGPAFSGAMLESIAAGIRTYMVLLPPHSCTMRYFRGAVLYETIEAVHHAVRAGLSPDHSEFFERYTSRQAIPDPVGKIWAALGA